MVKRRIPAVAGTFLLATFAFFRPAAAAPRFLALGDSYTAGTGVDEKKRWATELVRLFRDDNVQISDAEVIARTGWTTSDLLEAIQREKPRPPFALVTLMIGVNNQFQGGSVSAFRRDVAALLGKAVGLAGNDARNVVVLSIPDYGVMPYAKDRDRGAIAKSIDEFNTALREEARRAGAKWVDVTSVSRAAGRNPDLVGDDGLHPSWRLHGVWARLVYPVARPIVDRRR